MKNEPPPAELSYFAMLLADRFIQRRDLYAKQTESGYLSIKRPLCDSHLQSHLKGDMTLGAYVLDPDSYGRYLVLDADDDPDWRRLQAIAHVLAGEGAIGYLEASRRGGHLWYFLPSPLPAAEIRAFGLGVLTHFGVADMELFPKQDQLDDGPGSLIRLPFGIHLKSGQRYGFYLPNGEPVAPSLRQQITALAAAETVPNRLFSRFASIAPAKPPRPASKPFEWVERPLTAAEGATLSEQIKGTISVPEFVLQFVELNGQGMGLCPFHDDKVESFGVHAQRNYWHCFACGRGGSVIDFWMLWQKCDFKTAVKQLAKRLL